MVCEAGSFKNLSFWRQILTSYMVLFLFTGECQTLAMNLPETGTAKHWELVLVPRV